MDVRSCDICGSLTDAGTVEVGTGTFFVLKRQLPKDPIEQLLAQQHAPHAKYDLCPDCTRHFVLLMEARRTLQV